MGDIESPSSPVRTSPEPVEVSPKSPPPSTTSPTPQEASDNAPPAIPATSQKEAPNAAEPISADRNFNKQLHEKYKLAHQVNEAFMEIASIGDIGSIYRNRQIWINYNRTHLSKPALEVFRNIPSSRIAVYNYAGLLIHECTHYFFNKRENPQFVVDFSGVRDSANKLIDLFQGHVRDTNSNLALNDMLTWACSVASELSAHNAGRPSFAQTGIGAASILEVLKSCESVAKLIKLIDLLIVTMVDRCPDMCMNVLFDSSRHGMHFNWIWLHIAVSFPGSVVGHILKTGAAQFRVYVDEVRAKKNAVPSAFHVEYNTKFLAISEVFNFLMRKRNPELHEIVAKMINEGLNSSYNAKMKAFENIDFLFFLKLVTCSTETLHILVTNHLNLLTPWNVIRGIRQVVSVEKSLILPTATPYIDFVKQIVEMIDPRTHGIVFTVFIDIAFNQNLLTDIETSLEEKEANERICINIVPIIETMISRLLRVSHAPGSTNCPAQYPSISAFAHGRRLQFIIDSLLQNVERSAYVIRLLHAIAIAHDERKSAEIVLRFLLSISPDTSQFVYVLMGFITTTIKFQPTMMDVLFEDFFAFKTLVEQSLPDDSDRFKLHMNLLNNMRVMFEWDACADDVCPVAYFRLYPCDKTGKVLNVIFGETISFATEYSEEQDFGKLLEMIRMCYRLLTSVCAVNSPKQRLQRKVVMNLAEWYKMMAYLALLLKLSLSVVRRSEPFGISVFEETRTSILHFLYNGHLDVQMQPFVPVFIHLFLAFCFADSIRMFGEHAADNEKCLLDESGLNRTGHLVQLELEDGPPVLEGIRNIRLNDSVLDLVHSGQLKRRAKHTNNTGGLGNRKNIMSEAKEIELEDKKQRVFVLLDAVRTMCRAGAREVQLLNSKQVANLLVEVVCEDALTGDFRFDDWDLESDFIQRYVVINGHIERSDLCDGLLRILSDTRSFAYCMPIVKSQLAVVVNDAEKCADRSRCPEKMRQRLHRWMTLAIRAGVVTPRFAYLCDLEVVSNSHEAFLIFIELWHFMQARCLMPNIIENYHSELVSGAVDEGYPNENEATAKANFDVIRLVLHNHLTDVYHLFPKLFPSEYSTLKISVE